MKFTVIILILGILLIFESQNYAQVYDPGDLSADSWAQVMKEKKGTVSALWYDIDPFIYRTKMGTGMAGVEYELMEAFAAYVRTKYKVDLKIEWIDAKSFENIYPYIAKTQKKGLFGWSYYSITEERKNEVKFTPAYMPDVNIIITDLQQPLYATNEEFIKNLPGKTAYTMGTTMMEQDIFTIKNNFYNNLKINNEFDDYAVMEKISQHKQSFGYVPLSIYVMGLQKGIKVKRQLVLPSRREGFAAIYPKNSDWDSPVNEYFKSDEFLKLSATVIKKYIGNEITDLIFKASLPDSLRTAQSDNEMLTLEKEIVSKNLVASAIDVQKQKVIQNTIIAGVVVAFVIMLILFGMFSSKQKYASLLKHRNDIIVTQKRDIEIMNKKLEEKIMLSEMNPHLVFNSLNAIQYFITLDDKPNALKYLFRFSKHLRMIMDNASSLTVTLDKEIKMLNHYLELEKIRFENKFNYSIEAPKNLENLLAEIPSMLIQPLVEAALYFEVLARSSGNNFINISFTENNDILEVVAQYSSIQKNIFAGIPANGTGESFEKTFQKLKDRIALINYEKENKLAIHKKDNQDGTNTVFIYIPINK